MKHWLIVKHDEVKKLPCLSHFTAVTDTTKSNTKTVESSAVCVETVATPVFCSLNVTASYREQ